MKAIRQVVAILNLFLFAVAMMAGPMPTADSEEQPLGASWCGEIPDLCFAGGNEFGLYFIVQEKYHGGYVIWHFVEANPLTGSYEDPVIRSLGGVAVRAVKCTSDRLIISTSVGVVDYFCADKELSQRQPFCEQSWDIDPASGKMLGITGSSVLVADEKGKILQSVLLPLGLQDNKGVSAWWNTDTSILVHSPAIDVMAVLDMTTGGWDTYSSVVAVKRICVGMFHVEPGESREKGSLPRLLKCKHKWRTVIRVQPGKVEDAGENWAASLQRDIVVEKRVAIKDIGIIANILRDPAGVPLFYLDRWGPPFDAPSDHEYGSAKWFRRSNDPYVALWEGKALVINTQSAKLSVHQIPGEWPFQLRGISSEMVAVPGSTPDSFIVLSADGIVSKFRMTENEAQCMGRFALAKDGDNRVCAAFAIPQGFLAVHEHGVGAFNPDGERTGKKQRTPLEAVVFPDQSGRFLAFVEEHGTGTFLENVVGFSANVYSLEGLLGDTAREPLVTGRNTIHTMQMGFDTACSTGFIGETGIFCVLAPEYTQWDLTGLGRKSVGPPPKETMGTEEYGFSADLLWPGRIVLDLMTGEEALPGFRPNWLDIRSRKFGGSSFKWFLFNANGGLPRISKLYAMPANWRELKPVDRMMEVPIPEATYDFVVTGGKLVCLSEYGQILAIQGLPDNLKK